MKKKTVSKKKNTKLLIIVPLVVIVGLCIFFAIRNKTSVPDGAIVTTYEYEITKTFDCTDIDGGATINCECDVFMNNQHYKSSNTINTISCDNQAKLCDDACKSLVEDIKNK